MDIFNRIVSTLLILCAVVFWIFSAFYVVFFPFLPPPLRQPLGNLGVFLDQLSKAQGFQPAFVVLYAVLAVIIVAIGLGLLYLELWPRAPRAIRLGRVSSGSALLTVQAVAQRIKFEAEKLGDVGQVKPIVRPRGKTVDVLVDLRTRPDIDVSAKTEEVCQVVRDTVENVLGIHLNRLNVNIHLDPSLARGRPAPAGEPVVATPPVQPAEPITVGPPASEESSSGKSSETDTR